MKTSLFIKDVEGPAHIDWETKSQRPFTEYVAIDRTITFILNSVHRTVKYINKSSDQIDFTFFNDIFSIEDPENLEPSKKSRKKRGKDKSDASNCLRNLFGSE